MENIGGKAQALSDLIKAGFNVPALFVCDSSWTPERLASEISRELPQAEYFAVRSSAQQEDSTEKSFAGQFYSELGVTKDLIPSAVAKVQVSFGEMPGSVIVQAFIASDAGGVLFTDAGGHILINALPGLCAPVVGGKPCDEYVCTKDGLIIDKTILPAKHIQRFENGSIVTGETDRETLDLAQLKKLCSLANQLQEYFNSPQDVEWCFKNGELYVLQSRPITREVSVATKEYFDSANIAESYSGIVLPLTCSFAQHVYGQVYKDLLHASGVSNRTIAASAPVFDRLLGFFYGRMYYNMNNWYALATFLPGYKRNKENFELMITSNVKQQIANRNKPPLMLRLAYPAIVLAKTAVFGLTARRFKSLVNEQLRHFRSVDFSQAEYSQCVREFDRLHTQLLRRWYITVENDFFVMTYLGLLKKLLGEEQLQSLILFRSKATEQVGALAALSQTMQKIPLLWRATLADDTSAFNSTLTQYPAAKAELESYLLEFGGRFASELKLESIGIDEDETKLFALLKTYRAYESKPFPAAHSIQLPLFKKIAAVLVLRKFKKYASQREEFRLLRSNTFGVSRRLFRRMGQLLSERKYIEQADDVFYLHLNELLNAEKTGSASFSNLVAARKKEYANYAAVTPPVHFATTHDLPPPVNGADLSGVPLAGRGASAGIVRGRVKIFRQFSMPEKIDFDILVTAHTDPGWTSLIAVSKGLIIEHGGVLSHASIVARELQIPAVIGAPRAMDVLHDGQLVEINGTTGAITII